MSRPRGDGEHSPRKAPRREDPVTSPTLVHAGSSSPRDASPRSASQLEFAVAATTTPKVVRVVVTGGPCAGKSTILSKLLSEIGPREHIKVFAVPEASTLMVSSGLEWSKMTTQEQIFQTQLALIRVQIALEDQITAVAHATGEQCLVVCDRGTMDGRAYSPPEVFARICDALGQSQNDLMLRYDGVIHLVTAADGAESFYSKENNVARFENADEAKSVDHKLRQMYLGHPQLKIVGNEGTFENKVNRAIDHVYTFLNRRPPAHRSKRYLLGSYPDLNLIEGIKVRTLLTTTMLLRSENESRMLQKRQQEGGAEMYLFHSWKDNQLASQHRISQREYDLLLSSRDPTKSDVVKENVCFSYGGGFFDIAVVRSPEWVKGSCILYVEGNCAKLPEVLDVVRETTGVHEYSNEGLATPPSGIA